MPLILIGGGSRSGKSRHALRLAKERGGARLGFIATAQAFDDEMRDRIRKHQQERGPEFRTFEEPMELPGAIAQSCLCCEAVVVDCLTLWTSNLMLADREADADALIAACRGTTATVIVVTNEVGCGIVPDNGLARKFRDVAGWLNQRVAEAADEVYWMAFGIAMKVK
jgi:adenosylcobinamide kinase/adenosylcobinamide-phosphate guanylyltransferase